MASVNKSLNQSLMFQQQTRAEVDDLLQFLEQEGLTSQLQDIYRKYSSQKSTKSGSAVSRGSSRQSQLVNISKLRMTYMDLQRFIQY